MAGLLPFGLQNLKDPTQGLPFIILHRGAGIPVPFVFPLAPQMIDESWRARTAVQQTVAGNYLSDFSGATSQTPRVTLKGTFGYDVKVGGIGAPMHGSLHLRTFETIYETFNALSRELKKKALAVQEFIDLSRLHFWRVNIERLTVRRSEQQPTIAYYEIGLVRLEDYLSPVGPKLPPSTLVSGETILSDFTGGLL